uniref:NADH dehydrogenase subunit 6 n=1 Tax=Elliptio icterina TaxID=504354 RepID=A0A0C4K0E5_ELLIC|nr:NADH dehydrogenase subunit 6 [Anodonta lucida]AHJ59875.1 NADH dehydrogenase subunit 6 [Anodonta lucida]
MTLSILSSLWVYMILSMTLPMHPLPLGIMVLLLAFITCTLIALTSPWYSYMLFFIFIGGMLVMFAYIASLSPNMTYSINNPVLALSLTIIFFMTLNTWSLTTNNSVNVDIATSIKNTTQILSFLYSQNGVIYLIMLACMLLFTLVASVKICKPSSGALRPFMT